MRTSWLACWTLLGCGADGSAGDSSPVDVDNPVEDAVASEAVEVASDREGEGEVTAEFTLVYQSRVEAEIEPCG